MLRCCNGIKAMIAADSLILAAILVDTVLKEAPKEKIPEGEVRKRMIIRIAAAIEANALTLGDRVLLDPELKSLKAASDIVKQVFREEIGWAPQEMILPAVFEQRCPLPEIAAAYGMPIPRRRPPSKEVISIFDELIENPDVSREYERKAILVPAYPFDDSHPQHLVAVQVGHPHKKIEMLDTALDHSCFFEHLESVWSKSGKSKGEFSIIIKVHLIPMLRRDEVGVYTDPTLVLHLINRIMEAGWTNVTVAEGRNSFGNWFGGRGVARVAARAGYIEEEEVPIEGKSPPKVFGHVLVNKQLMPFNLVDLSHELVEHDFAPDLLGKHPVSRLWRDADYRITFGKLKTHFSDRYALNIFNISLALPMEDRLMMYPTQKAAAKAVTALLEAFPVHFSFIDGITAADGVIGLVRRPRSRTPGIIIAGQSLLATESLAAQMMGIDPFESVYTRMASERLGGMTPYKVIGDVVLLNPWRNVRSALVGLATTIMERFPKFANLYLPLSVGRIDPCFPPKGTPEELKRRKRLAWLSGARPLGVWLTRRDGLLIVYRIARLKSRVMARAVRMPLSAGYPDFFEEARHLSIEDMFRLREILEHHGEAIQKGDKKVVRAGHIIMVGEETHPFAGQDALGVICAGRILKGIRNGRWTYTQVLPELDRWKDLRTTWREKIQMKLASRKKIKSQNH